MTDTSAATSVAALVAWLQRDALPLWATDGTDLDNGGFFEKIGQDGQVIDAPRRTRVVGRQIFSYATALRHGWYDDGERIVRHGLACLRSHCLGPDGFMVSTSTPDGVAISAAFDLYDHAFTLFGLAAAARAGIDAAASEDMAVTLMRRMIARFGRPDGGFEESDPPSQPLKANPHMHMLEACLAWAEAGSAAPEWIATADAIARLALDHFIDQETGALREFFDARWRPIAGEAGRLVEPGHQFEWAWLLLRWAALAPGRDEARIAAERLIALAERHGTDPARGVAFDELWDDLSPRTTTARLWPQTERLKAFSLLMAAPGADRARLAEHVAAAATGLQRYLQTPKAGLWRDRLRDDDTFVDEPAPASSLYHIVCGVEVAFEAQPVRHPA